MTKTKSPTKSAIIIGVTGQDGSYLAEHLFDAGYLVLGIKRRSSTDTTINLKPLIERGGNRFTVMEGDITDYSSMSGVFTRATELFGGAPHEVYNLAAQSHVGESFKQPLATWDSTAQGVMNILEVMRQDDYIPTTKFYQASTSEMFGDNYKLVPTNGSGTLTFAKGCVPPDFEVELIQDESVSFNPRSPYAVAKVAAHQAVGLYRDAYNLFGCCGILFNHESPRRGEHFVTRKITKWVGDFWRWRLRGKKMNNGLGYDAGFDCDAVSGSIFYGMDSFHKLRLGNLSAHRDWGHAKDYVRAMHMMLQHDKPDDYIVATGESHSVADFCAEAFKCVGISDWEQFVMIDKNFIRPAEVPHLDGRSNKAYNTLGWSPQVTFRELVEDMTKADMSETGV